jgi:uncharacterized protein YecA (UPF0149 family)
MGSPLEAALLTHEKAESERDFFTAFVQAFGTRISDSKAAIEDLQEMYMPGTRQSKQRRVEEEVQMIRDAQKVDWSKVFVLPDDMREMIEERAAMSQDSLRKHYIK